jgi:serine/threonine-protein kinase
VFQAALERDAHERAAFLREACGEDETLRSEVQSLLDAHGEAGAFANRPAVETLGFAAGSVSDGMRLGAYRIGAKIGAGGMGEVFRAHDTTLKRDVAIKLLSPDFSVDPDSLARLEREARLLASLNHPNICAIYGIERSPDGLALVLELVEGPTLAERLAKRALPLRDALAIARQIAEALDAAHERGIIHRDLKPANIKITPDGLVKVLDFGLAKEVVADSATLSGREGLLLGTAAYMSPQQARGQLLDKRTDIWAFGCVFYEMLSGRRAFDGATSSDAIAAVIERQPDWTALPPATPPAICALVERCLQKDLKLRLRDIGDARLEVDRAITMSGNDAPLERARHHGRRALPWAVSGALGVVLALVLVRMATSNVSTPPPRRVSAELGTSASLMKDQTGGGTAIVLSPDGTRLTFVAQKTAGARPQLYIRYLDQLQALPLSGTEGAVNPFFSPDQQWIGFFADGKLKKIPTFGGGVFTLCDAIGNRGGDWAEDGTIVFAPDRAGTSLWRVSSAGGAPVALTSLGPGEITQRWPQVLARGRAVLYTGNSVSNGFEDANVVVQPLPDGKRKVLVRGAYAARYLSSGHLVYIHDDTLFAAPFDLDSLELTGQAVRVLEGLTTNVPVGAAQFTISASGTLAYLPGQRINYDAPMHWMNRQGKTSTLRATPAFWREAHVAPDGRRVAVEIYDGRQSDIWVYEWERDRLSRLTSDSVDDQTPVWTPDGSRIAYMSKRADNQTRNIYWRRADGTGEVQRLTESVNQQFVGSWHPSGKFLAFSEGNPPPMNSALMILRMEGNEVLGWKPGKPQVIANGPFSEFGPMFSPDGRWLAYQSNEFGRFEILVRPFPGPGGPWQISTDGGTDPTWSRTRQELFFGSPDHRIMVAAYSVDRDSFHADKPRAVSESHFAARTSGRNFDLHPDGERFVLGVEPESADRDDGHHVTLIFNFFDELRRIVRTSTR